MKRVCAVLLALILCCSPVLGSIAFAGHLLYPCPPGDTEEWNGPFEHETLAFYFPDPNVPELAVRGLRKIEMIDGADNCWWEYADASVIVIPDEVGGYPVTSVDTEAFTTLDMTFAQYDQAVERVYVGKNVRYIGHHAFSDVAEVVIGKNTLQEQPPENPEEHYSPFATVKHLYLYKDSDAYRLIEPRLDKWIITFSDESHLISDKVKIDEALNVYLPWGVTKETLGDYVSVDGDAQINVPGDTIENGTQIELVNATYGTIDNTYTVVLEEPQITLTVEPQRTAFAKTTFSLDASVTTTGEPCTLTYASDDPDVAAVDENGVVTTYRSGAATITVTATDPYGFSETAVCTVTVKYNWWQWLIRIFLFGWLWY